MRLWVMSDLHVDVCAYTPAPTPLGTDVIVVAGDVCNRLHDRALPWLREHLLPRGLPLIYVPGNHDFYRENVLTELRKAYLRASEYGIHLLPQGESISLGGTRFIGATLWTDFAVGGDAKLGQIAALQHMNDYKHIRYGTNYRRWLTKDALLHHYQQRAAIETVLREPHAGPSVVISHHAPHPRSLFDRAVTDALDAAYASDLSGLMARYKPTLWIHGHIHANRDYRMDETRIVSNPRGNVYTVGQGKRETVVVENSQHDPVFTVEV